MRFLIAFIACLALSFGFASAAQAEEEQGWQSDVEHIHMRTDLPMLSTLSGSRTVNTDLILHNSRATINSIRWSCESSVKQTKSVNFVGTGTPVQTFPTQTLTVNPSLCAKGWREIRFTVKAEIPGGVGQEFTTSRRCVNFTVGSTASNYCGGPTVAGRCGGGAWYVVPEYLIGFIDCRDWQKAQTTGFRPGEEIRVRTQNSGGGIATFDPDFHNGNIGVGITTTPPNNTWTRVKVPQLAAGQHVLHLRDRRAGFSGVVVMPLKIV